MNTPPITVEIVTRHDWLYWVQLSTQVILVVVVITLVVMLVKAKRS